MARAMFVDGLRSRTRPAAGGREIVVAIAVPNTVLAIAAAVSPAVVRSSFSARGSAGESPPPRDRGARVAGGLATELLRG